MDGLKIGEFIVWQSARGTGVGKIVSIDIRMNADKKLHPWIVIEECTMGTKISMPADDDYLKMMRVVKMETV